MTFGMKRYFDEEKNEWVNKGLTIVDGKILDPSGVYIIKKNNFCNNCAGTIMNERCKNGSNKYNSRSIKRFMCSD